MDKLVEIDQLLLNGWHFDSLVLNKKGLILVKLKNGVRSWYEKMPFDEAVLLLSREKQKRS